LTLDPGVLAETAVRAARSKKAYDIVVLDISASSIMADNFLICAGRSTIHVKSIAEGIIEEIEKELGIVPRLEGWRQARWILMDYGSLIVHVFLEEDRKFYNLERLWGAAGKLGLVKNE
jgi:ribosome-associated protein